MAEMAKTMFRAGLEGKPGYTLTGDRAAAARFAGVPDPLAPTTQTSDPYAASYKPPTGNVVGPPPVTPPAAAPATNAEDETMRRRATRSNVVIGSEDTLG